MDTNRAGVVLSVGTTASTKGVDSLEFREEFIINPCELPDTSRSLDGNLTATIGVVEVLLNLAVVHVLRVFERLECLVDCSVIIRCFDLLGIYLALDQVNGPYSG